MDIQKKFGLAFVFIYVLSLGSVEGIRCWTCENADSIEECDKNGTLVQCAFNQNTCGIEVRHRGSWAFPDRIKVHKFCKQGRACDNVQNQNWRPAYKETQCNPKWPYSVCRCCCEGDGCNLGDLKCLDMEEPTVCFPDITAPVNGNVNCTNGSNFGSECTFQCDRGHNMAGSMRSTCQTTKRWTEFPPTCKPMSCPPIFDIDNGSHECTDGVSFGSICKFACDSGYQLFGSESSICEKDSKSFSVGRWSTRGQECKRVQCDTELKAPAYGTKSCTDKQYLGSVCEFSCNEGYVIAGTEEVTCIGGRDRQPEWDNESPKCQKKECLLVLRPPTNGFMRCTDGRRLGSTCTFECSPQYDIVGSQRAVCNDHPKYMRAVWDNRTPRCARKKCRLMPEAPTNGSMVCSDWNYYGSVCIFDCNKGYKRVGMSYIMCEASLKNSLERPEWNHDVPICKRKQCEAVSAPTNGFVTCTDGTYFGSKCEYTCNDFRRRIGPLYTECRVDESGSMVWSNKKLPVCKRIKCSQLKDVRFGKMECTDSEYVNSECKFSCTMRDYHLTPKTRHSITCMNDSKWSEQPPCCARSCPPYAVMDLVVILDSSSSIGTASWKIMLDFVNNIFELFVVQRDAMNFGVIRYNNKIDTETQINLDDCPDNVTMLKDLVSKLPYNGAGTWTGQAMDYVHKNMLLFENGNRKLVPDVVLVITDGRSQDDVRKPAYALRDAGVLTFALGITPTDGKLDMVQLADIAGSKKNLFLAKDGFDTLTPEFAKEISENICGNPCERPLY